MRNYQQRLQLSAFSLYTVLTIIFGLTLTGCRFSGDSDVKFGSEDPFNLPCPTEDNPFDYYPDGQFDAKDVEECILANDIERYLTIQGTLDGMSMIQHNLSVVFGNTAFRIRVRHSDEKPYCLATSSDKDTLQWVGCEEKSLNTQFYFARTPIKTTVKDFNNRGYDLNYDDYAIQIVPADELNRWSFFINSNPPRCLSAKDNHQIKLAPCGNGKDVWVNLPNTHKGDAVLNEQNRYSNMVLVDNPSSIDGLLTDEGLVHPVLGLTSGFARQYEGRKALSEMTENPREDATIVMTLTEQDLPNKYLYTNDLMIENDIGIRNSIENCHHLAMDVVGDSLQYSCLNIYSPATRDDKADGDVQSPLGKAKKWTKSSNLHIMFAERCEGRLVPGVAAACDQESPIRSLAEDRMALKGSVVQLKSEDEKLCAFLKSGQIKYESCNQRNEKGSQFLVETFLDEDSFPTSIDSEGEIDPMEDLWGFHAVVRPYNQQDKCVSMDGSGSFGLTSGPCPKYKLRGSRLLLSGRLTTGVHKTQDIAYCKSAFNIGTGIEFDCQDYVSPALRKMLIAADILSFIPGINIIVSPILQGIVCSAREVSISGEGCMGLAMGLPIDIITLPLDLMTAGALMNGIKAAATRAAIKVVVREGVQEIGEEAAEKAVSRVLRGVAQTTAGETLDFDTLTKGLPKIMSRLDDEGVDAGKAMADFNKVIQRQASAAESRMANQLADRVSNLVKFERRIDATHVEKYLKGYFATNDISNLKKSSFEALEQSLFLKLRLSPKVKKALVTDLGSEVFGTGVGFSVFAGMGFD